MSRSLRAKSPGCGAEDDSRKPVSEAAAKGLRLHKFLAEAGVASRRKCEELILAGRVRVNGQLVNTLPAWVNHDRDHVEVDGQVIRPPGAKGPTSGHLYVALHKPNRVISTVSDTHGRTTVMDLVDLPNRQSRRIFPVGRLDADSTGLILLTSDGELAQRLTHPRHGITKKYMVEIRGRVSSDDLGKLSGGLFLTRPIRSGGSRPGARRATTSAVRMIGRPQLRSYGECTKLLMTLREGQNRQIRRMFARLGLRVRRLQRIAIGPVSIKGLAVGQWRFLDNRERQAMMRAVKLKPR